MAISFKEGDIILIKNVSYTDHSKYQLTLNTEKNLFFVINSEINNTVALNNDFRNCQVILNKNPNHIFMPNDISYIACHQLAPMISCDKIENIIKAKQAENCGKIDKDTLEKVKKTVLNYSRLTLTPFDILYIIEGLNKIK